MLSECYDLCMSNTARGDQCRKVKKRQWTTKESIKNFLVPYQIQCDGVSAKYVRVELPGKRRILDAKIMVHRAKPLQKDLDKWPMACHAIEYHDGTITNGPLNETKDSFDPVFYGTCYTLTPSLQGWIKHPNRTQVIDIHWKYGEKCLKCEKYKALKSGAQSDIQGNLDFINWEETFDYSGTCFNCDKLETGPWSLKPRRRYEGDKIAGNEANDLSMEKNMNVLQHEVLVLGISKENLEKNKEKVRKALGNALGISPNIITKIDIIDVKINERNSRVLNSQNNNDDDELGDDFGIESSENLYDKKVPTAAKKSKITYEVRVDEQYDLLKRIMISSTFETNLAMEIAIATGNNPNNVRVDVNLEPKIHSSVVSGEANDDNTGNLGKDDKDKNNDATGIIIVIIAIFVLSCGGYFYHIYIQKKTKSNNVFKAFQNARSDNNSNTNNDLDNRGKGNMKTKSLELAAVALAIPEVEKLPQQKKEKGMTIATFMGKGKILEYRDDGFIVAQLMDWKLAQGTKVAIYLKEKRGTTSAN